MQDENVNQEIISVEAEEIDVVEDQIKREVARYNLTDAKIGEMKQMYGGLVINGADDKEGYNKVSEAYATVKKTRTAIENKRKQLKDGYLKITTGIDGEAKRLTNLIKPLEEELKEKKDAIDKEKELAKQAKEKEETERLEQRIRDLIAAGMVFDGSCYAIGDVISVDIVTVRNMPADKYEVLKAKVQFEKMRLDKLEEERKAEELRKKEEFELQQKQLKEQQEAFQRQQDELKRQQEEFQRQQEALKRQQEEAELQRQKLEEDKRRQEEEMQRQEKERQQKEAADKLADLKRLITSNMLSAGLSQQGEDFYFKNNFGFINLSMAQAVENGLEWARDKAVEFGSQITQWEQAQRDFDAEELRKKEEADAAELQRQIELGRRQQQRISDLIGLGFTYHSQLDHYVAYDIAVTGKQIKELDPELWTILFAEVGAKLEVSKKEWEALRQSKLGDEQKLAEYVAALKAVPGPGTLATDEASRKYGRFYDEFNFLTDNLLK